jgi:hypothetical protein
VERHRLAGLALAGRDEGLGLLVAEFAQALRDVQGRRPRHGDGRVPRAGEERGEVGGLGQRGLTAIGFAAFLKYTTADSPAK